MELRKGNGKNRDTMFDFLQPRKFQDVAKAAQACAGFDEINHSYSKPSSAIRQVIKNLAEIKLQQALEDGDSLSAEESREFMSLCEMRWTELSTTARRNLSERKRNAVSLIPLSDDVKKFSLYLTAEGERNASILKSDKKNFQAFSTLNSIALSKLILFNRKRQGEASKILLKDWQFNKKANITSEMAGCFSEVENGLEAGVPGVRMEGQGGPGATFSLSLTYILFISYNLFFFIQARHVRGRNCLSMCEAYMHSSISPFLNKMVTISMRGQDIQRIRHAGLDIPIVADSSDEESTSAETCSALEQLLRDVRTVTLRHDAMQYKIAILESQKKHLQGELAKADSENKCFQTSISELYFSGDSTQVSGPSAEQLQPEE